MAKEIEEAPTAAPQLPSPPITLPNLANGEEAAVDGNNEAADNSCFPTPFLLPDLGEGEAVDRWRQRLVHGSFNSFQGYQRGCPWR